MQGLNNVDWKRLDELRREAGMNAHQHLEAQLKQSNLHAASQQAKHNSTSRETKQVKKVYEYVAYYAPTADELKQNPDIAEAIIASDKLIADSEATVRTKVIRLIPAEYEAVIDKVKIEVRAFR